MVSFKPDTSWISHYALFALCKDHQPMLLVWDMKQNFNRETHPSMTQKQTIKQAHLGGISNRLQNKIDPILHYCCLARKVDGEEASQCGLVSKLFDDKERRYELLLYYSQGNWICQVCTVGPWGTWPWGTRTLQIQHRIVHSWWLGQQAAWW